MQDFPYYFAAFAVCGHRVTKLGNRVVQAKGFYGLVLVSGFGVCDRKIPKSGIKIYDLGKNLKN